MDLTVDVIFWTSLITMRKRYISMEHQCKLQRTVSRLGHSHYNAFICCCDCLLGRKGYSMLTKYNLQKNQSIFHDMKVKVKFSITALLSHNKHRAANRTTDEKNRDLVLKRLPIVNSIHSCTISYNIIHEHACWTWTRSPTMDTGE